MNFKGKQLTYLSVNPLGSNPYTTPYNLLERYVTASTSFPVIGGDPSTLIGSQAKMFLSPPSLLTCPGILCGLLPLSDLCSCLSESPQLSPHLLMFAIVFHLFLSQYLCSWYGIICIIIIYWLIISIIINWLYIFCIFLCLLCCIIFYFIHFIQLNYACSS